MNLSVKRVLVVFALLSISILGAKCDTSNQTPEQDLVIRMFKAGTSLEQKMVVFNQYAGWPNGRTVDNGVQWFANEAGTIVKDGPMIDCQPGGTPSMAWVYLKIYQETKHGIALRVCKKVGDTLLSIQDFCGGGWHYDLALIDGQWRSVMAWSKTRQDDIDMIQGVSTLDDGISQSCALYLLRLFQATNEQKYLAGAKKFGDAIVGLKDVKDKATGKYPYRNGGIPQAFPFDKVMKIVFSSEDGQPGEHYYVHKTYNDKTTTQTLLFMMELYAETKETKYLEAIRLTIDYTLDRFEQLGSRAWCQQYHYLTDEPAWGRHKEPPAFVSGEHEIIEMLLAWRQKETNSARKARIERAILKNLLYWKYEAERVNGDESNIAKWQWWRYYNAPRNNAPNTNPGLGGRPINTVMFASKYAIYYGIENEDKAASGQPWKLGNPRRWLGKILTSDDKLYNLDRYSTYWNPDKNLFGVNGIKIEIAKDKQDTRNGLWLKKVRLDGQERDYISIGYNASGLHTLLLEYQKIR